MKWLLLLISGATLTSCGEKEREAVVGPQTESKDVARLGVEKDPAPSTERSSPAEGKGDDDEDPFLAFEGGDLEKLANAPSWLVEAIANEPEIKQKHLYAYRSTDPDHYDVITSSVSLAELKKGELPGMGVKFSVRRDRDGKAFVGVPEYFHY